MVGRNNMKRIRTAIIGLGNIAHGYDDIPAVKKRIAYPTHLSALTQDGRFELIAAADPSVSAQHAFRNKVPQSVEMYANYRHMLRKEGIDLLVVAAPTALHYRIVADALRFGCTHILCEKPITKTVAEARKLEALAKRYRATIHVNYLRSYDKNYARLAREIQKGTFGHALTVTVRYNKGVHNIATHAIHLLEKIFGPITRIESARQSLRGPDPTICFTAYCGGVRLYFDGVDIAPSAFRLFEIDMLFDQGRLWLEHDTLREFAPERKDGYSYLREQKPRVRIDIGKSMLDVYEHIFRVRAGRERPAADLPSSIHALRVAEAAVRSAKSGKPVRV